MIIFRLEGVTIGIVGYFDNFYYITSLQIQVIHQYGEYYKYCKHYSNLDYDLKSTRIVVVFSIFWTLFILITQGVLFWRT